MPIRKLESAGEKITREDAVERIDPEVRERLAEHHGLELGQLATFQLRALESSTAATIDEDLAGYEKLHDEYRNYLQRLEKAHTRTIRGILRPAIPDLSILAYWREADRRETT